MSERESAIVETVYKRMHKLSEQHIIHLLNPIHCKKVDQIPIFSFIIPHLHYNFIVALLNDLFGIQSRGGVSCSGIYATRLLEINKKHEDNIINNIVSNKGMPTEYGWTRITFYFLMPDYIIKYILDCIEFVGLYGHIFQPLYNYDKKLNLWKMKFNFDQTHSDYSQMELLDYDNIRQNIIHEMTKADCGIYLRKAYTYKKLIQNLL